MTAKQPSPVAAPVAAIVLAAGRSSRMGALKPLLPFAGVRVIEHVVATLAAAGIAPIHVVVGHRGAEVAAVARRCGAVVVDNPDFDLGMYSSIRAGIASLPASVAGTLLLPVDIAAVRATTFALIAEAGRSTATLVHPTFRGEPGHPPFLPRALFAEILAGAGEGGLAALVARHDDEAIRLPVVDRACLRDMDHPADHASLAAAVPHRHVPESEECEAIFDAFAAEPRVRRHGAAVAALALALADRLIASGVPLDRDLVRAGAVLHDIAKGRAHHAEVGAVMLRDLGFPVLAAVVAQHMVIGFAAGDPIDEAAVVHLADKLVADDRRVRLDDRWAAAERRFGDDPAALAGAHRRRATAEAILHDVEARIGPIDPPTDVAPLRPPLVEARLAP